MKRRTFVFTAAALPVTALAQIIGSGGTDNRGISYREVEVARAKAIQRPVGSYASSDNVADIGGGPSRYLGQSDFAKSVPELLYSGAGGAASIDAFDPYWIDKEQNGAAINVIDGIGNNGYDASGNLVAYRLLRAGVPTVDLASYTGLASPNEAAYRGCTAGVARATGIQVDAEGRVGMFINGFDTPSDRDGDRFRGFGPDIHLSRSYASPVIYLGPTSPQCLHMACTLTLGTTYFSPAAGTTAGAGGQVGWRASFRRADNQPFSTGVDKIVFLLGFWDSRSIGDPGFDGNDATGNETMGEHWIAGTIAAGKTSQFVENYGQTMLTGQAGGRTATFYWNISRANMVNILAAFSASTTTPEMVCLSDVTFNGELYDNRPTVAEFKPGQFGFSFANQTVDIW